MIYRNPTYYYGNNIIKTASTNVQRQAAKRHCQRAQQRNSATKNASTPECCQVQFPSYRSLNDLPGILTTAALGSQVLGEVQIKQDNSQDILRKIRYPTALYRSVET